MGEAILEAALQFLAELVFNILPRRLQVGCAIVFGLGLVALIGITIWHAILT